MKNFTLLVALCFAGWTTYATTTNTVVRPNYGEAFIFIEGGVEFAVYPDGEFDFHYNPQFVNTSIVNITHPGVNISYNAGFSYDAFVQFDDYGAVIQIENVPVFYDYYGRIIQAGNVMIDYNSQGHIVQVGGLQIRYNSFNQPARYIGYINQYNTRYVFRPWHRYYVRPHSSHRVVYYEPYRAFYQPVRMNYVQYTNVYQTNNHYYSKTNFYRPGQQVASYNYGRRTTAERDLSPAARSNQNVSRDYVDNTSTKATTRSNVSSGRNATTAATTQNVARERANLERHQAAVRAQSGNTSTSQNATRRVASEVNRESAVSTQRSSTTNTPVIARSSETGRSTSTANTQPASVNRSSSTRVQNTPARSTDVRSTQNNTNGSSVRSSAPAQRSSTVRPASGRSSTPSTRSSGIRG